MKADGIFLVRPDLVFKSGLPLWNCNWETEIQMPWYQKATTTTRRIYCDLCAFVAEPEGVAAALDAKAAEKVPHLESLHGIGGYNMKVGTFVPDHFGSTFGKNDFFSLRGGKKL
jgi:hypothetical protein